MIRSRVFAVLALIVIILAVTASPSFAASLCFISNTTPLTFNAVGDSDGPRDGRASFSVTCARTQTTNVSLLYSHRMKGTTGGADLAYDLYTTSGRTTIWGSGGDGITVPMTFAAGRPTIMYIYARIPANQRPAAGQYHENIEILTMP